MKINIGDVYEKVKGIGVLFVGDKAKVEDMTKTSVVLKAGGVTHRITKKTLQKDFIKVSSGVVEEGWQKLEPDDVSMGTVLRVQKESKSHGYVSGELLVVTQVPRRSSDKIYYLASSDVVKAMDFKMLQDHMVLHVPTMAGLVTGVRLCSEAFQSLMHSGLNERAIITLIHDMTKVSRSDIKKILDAGTKLEKEFLKE